MSVNVCKVVLSLTWLVFLKMFVQPGRTFILKVNSTDPIGRDLFRKTLFKILFGAFHF